MMEGLHVCRKNEYLEKSAQENGSISLLAKGHNNEIMRQIIKKGNMAYINPGNSDELLEFLYILNGSITLHVNDEKLILETGDYFYVNKLKELVQFETNDDTELMYFSSQPVFFNISKRLNDLRDIAKKSQEKDLYTHDHGARVQHYAVIIANKLDLPKEKIENIFFASLFHDIGKIEVPDYVLNKPGKLTDEEMEFIKRHPITGMEMVNDTYYEDLSKIILQHHEWINGEGYPNGIKGDQICIEARIISVADAYDALTTDRSYRKGFTAQKAVEILKSESGWKYDPEVLEKLIEILNEEKTV